MSDDEFDVFPDDFADMQDVDWARLLGGPSASNTESGHESTRSGFQNTDLPVIQAGPSSPNSSPDYFGHDYDDLDPAFLAELDRVEQQVVQAPHVSRPSYVPRGTMSREAVAEAVSRGAGTSSSVRVSGAAYVSQSLLASGARTSPYFLTLNRLLTSLKINICALTK
ncbi:hypothetical protein B0H34DRAFT_684931 [Crassisporium funariophilum]|nr:hypothetical protein B0H34DRAFT_684931 [Crassisporium funariophilum]